MCYINGIKVSLKEFIKYKQQEKELKLLNEGLLNQPAKRGFDYGDWPVIKPSEDGKDWEVVAMQWGYVPDWVQGEEGLQRFRHGYKDEKGVFNVPYTTLNAKGEEILDKGKMWQPAAKSRRCLALSSGFYEHRHIPVMGKRGKLLKTPEKFPYHITIDKPVFMIAALWNDWTNRDTGEIISTFALVTTDAVGINRQIHNAKLRMPVIFTDELADEWTDPNLTETRIKELAVFKYPADRFKGHLVTKDFLVQEDPTVMIEDERVPDLIYEE